MFFRWILLTFHISVTRAVYFWAARSGIAKLSVLLGETEDQLRRLRNHGSIDPGVGSLYDGVQGLDAETPHLERKTHLMQAIFEANLEMRNLLPSQRADPA